MVAYPVQISQQPEPEGQVLVPLGNENDSLTYRPI